MTKSILMRKNHGKRTKFSFITKCRLLNIIYDSSTYVYIFYWIDINLFVEIVEKLQFKIYDSQNTQKPSRIIQKSIKVNDSTCFFLWETNLWDPHSKYHSTNNLFWTRHYHTVKFSKIMFKSKLNDSKQSSVHEEKNMLVT